MSSDSSFIDDLSLPSISSSSTKDGFFISKRNLYIIAAIVVLGVLIWVYQSYTSPDYPISSHYHPMDDMHDMHYPHLSRHNHPAFTPPPILSTSPQVPTKEENVLLELEKELTYNYEQFQSTFQSQPNDIPSLQNWVNSITSLYSKMKIEVDRLSAAIPDETIKQQLRKGLEDAEQIMNQAQNTISEKKRIASSDEASQESLDVLKNMHYIGLGNKIKNSRANLIP